MLGVVIKHFPLQVCIFVQGAHHPPLHPEQPGLAGEESGAVERTRMPEIIGATPPFMRPV